MNQGGTKSEKIVLSGSPGGAFGLVPGLVPGESDQRFEYLSSSDHTRFEHRDRELPIMFSSRPRILWVGIGLVRLGWTGNRLDWIELDWIGLDAVGLDGVGLDWIGLDWI